LLLEFCNFLALLKFSCGASLFAKNFTREIPNFDAFMQEDAAKLHTHLISRLFEDLKGSVAIKDEVQGLIETSCLDSAQIFSSSTEEFSITSLPTKSLSSLQEASMKYFEVDPLETIIEYVFVHDWSKEMLG
jgi:hypothetical protein